jgi:hypothetical protein
MAAAEFGRGRVGRARRAIEALELVELAAIDEPLRQRRSVERYSIVKRA